MQWGIDAKTLSGGENPYDVTWTSSATDVLTAEQTGDDNTQGTITGIKAGKADVTAEVAGVSSEKAEVKVIALPVDLELNASNTVKENSVVYDEGGDLVVFISPTSGYGQIMLTLTDAYKGGGYAGHLRYSCRYGSRYRRSSGRGDGQHGYLGQRRRDNRFVLDYG